tara:strand:+ start:344 stop:586 length:243 start_codon:yes stop_codon:yes gene_type:complete
MTKKEDLKQIEKAIDALYKVETMEIMQEEIPTLDVGGLTNLAEVVGVSGAIDKLNKYLAMVEYEINTGELPEYESNNGEQ